MSTRFLSHLGWTAMVAGILAGGTWVQAQGPLRIQAANGIRIPTPSKYWVGLECVPADDEILRKQLDLPEDQGLVVIEIVPDSPADKAGLKRFDILLKANDQPLSQLGDLTNVVSKGKDVTLDMIRGGKATKITVQVGERPKRGPAAVPDPDDIVLHWFGRGEGKLPPQFRFMRPGTPIVVQPMPKDMTVTIQKQGEDPAKITVKRGDKTWETTDEKLDSLPEDVRPHVEAMLGRAAFSARPIVRELPNVFHPGAFEELNKRLDEMQKELKALTDKVNK